MESKSPGSGNSRSKMFKLRCKVGQIKNRWAADGGHPGPQTQVCSVRGHVALGKGCVCVCVCVLLSRIRLVVTPWTVALQVPLSVEFSGKNTGVGCHFLLQRIFPTQGLNPGLPQCRQILYHLSHQGSPLGKVKWVEKVWTRTESLGCKREECIGPFWAVVKMLHKYYSRNTTFGRHLCAIPVYLNNHIFQAAVIFPENQPPATWSHMPCCAGTASRCDSCVHVT